MSELLKIAMNAFESRLANGVLKATPQLMMRVNQAMSKMRILRPDRVLLNELGSTAQVSQMKAELKTSPRYFSRLREQAVRAFERQREHYDYMGRGAALPGRFMPVANSQQLKPGSEGIPDIVFSRDTNTFNVVKTHNNNRFLGGGRSIDDAIIDNQRIHAQARAIAGDRSGFSRPLGYELGGENPITMYEYVGGSQGGNMDAFNKTTRRMGYDKQVQVQTQSGSDVGSPHLWNSVTNESLQDLHNGNFVSDIQGRATLIDSIPAYGVNPRDYTNGEYITNANLHITDR